MAEPNISSGRVEAVDFDGVLSDACANIFHVRVGAKTDDQLASWTWAKPNSKGRIVPQTIAHRGYKAEHPENTLKAFQGAVEVGTQAIETDIHLSKDGVVLLSHVGLQTNPILDRDD